MGFESCDLFQIGAGVQNEDAAVPEVVAAGQIALGSFLVGFLVEGLHGVSAAVEAFERCALADVAVAGVRLARFDAEQHETASRGDLGGTADPFYEAGFILHDMVGRHDDQNCARVFA